MIVRRAVPADAAGVAGVHARSGHYAIYLDPSVWRRGAGSQLLTAALDSVPADVPATALWAFAQNRRARGFYERHGYVADGAAQTLEIAGAALHEVRYRRLSSRSTTMVG